MLAGLLVFRTPGAVLVGGAIGFIADLVFLRYVIPRQRQDALLQSYAVSLVQLCAKMCKIDGRVSDAEIRTFRGYIYITDAQNPLVGDLFNRARASAEGLEFLAGQVARMLGAGSAQLELVFEMLAAIAKADGTPSTEAQVALLKVAQIFSLTQAQVDAALDRLDTPQTPPPGARPYQSKNDAPPPPPPSGPDPYKALGLKPIATFEEVKKAHRKLVQQNHPDLLRGRGASAKDIAKAEAKMADINAAYTEIKKRTGN